MFCTSVFRGVIWRDPAAEPCLRAPNFHWFCLGSEVCHLLRAMTMTSQTSKVPSDHFISQNGIGPRITFPSPSWSPMPEPKKGGAKSVARSHDQVGYLYKYSYDKVSWMYSRSPHWYLFFGILSLLYSRMRWWIQRPHLFDWTVRRVLVVVLKSYYNKILKICYYYL